MQHGFIKVAAATSKVELANPLENSKHIQKMIKEASEKGVDLLTFQELTLTGYTCNDIFYQPLLLEKALEALVELKHFSKDYSMLICVGLPLVVNGKIFNCAALLNKGKIVGVVSKTYLPNYSEFYEARHFQKALDENKDIMIDNEVVPFGNKLLFSCKEVNSLKVGVEICEDLWTPIPVSASHCLNGANIILNPSASNEVVGKEEYRRLLISSTSARLICGYVYASCGEGESTQDLVFSGHNLIYENGSLLIESERFNNGMVVSEIDVEKLNYERSKMSTYILENNKDYQEVFFSLDVKKNTLTRKITPYPFEPNQNSISKERAAQILNIQAHGLKRRIEHTHAKKIVLGLSGGLDSSLAIIVMVKALELLNRPASDCLAVSMPCFGTTDLTKTNAYKLAKCLGVSFLEVNIKDAVIQHFKDIDHDINNYDITYENSQARERTQVLMDLANKYQGFVVGTGDLSELALGWATYNGDHMSMYGVNGSIPKTLIRHLIYHYAITSNDEVLKETLFSIIDTPVSPELIPPKDGVISQVTEDIVGPYELHDFFLYYYFRFGYAPKKLYRIAMYAFGFKYDKKIIYKYLRNFYYRFYAQQFKRSTLPDGVKVGSVCLSPRGDLRMPSDCSSRLFLNELDELEHEIE